MPKLQKMGRSRRISPAGMLLIVAANLCLHDGLLRGEAFGVNSGNNIRCTRTKRNRNRSPTTALHNTYDNNDNNNYSGDNANDESLGSYWRTPNNFSMFLTQRSIQSFMFLTSQLRDPETCYWVEDFTQPNLVAIKEDSSSGGGNTDDDEMKDADSMTSSSETNKDSSEQDERTCHLLRYHGLAAMDTELFPTWENYFESMLEQPTDVWVIASDQPHIPDYTWEIDPNSLCSRILSVREQLSKEFAKDLQAVSDMGGQTFDWYWERLK
eukprot:CAMPEP_0116123338 /NCGR_PEP_ID=MMETSP0329-20121206/4695_1 /TAXON_ID=697910 /ORGANISM="Pseudo-nitzschia arenysensis, Strain B593" /LENGTH=267 /DNA_ID=CAMNT_0003617247 /DNA_START=277 /DNA_END=1077 /DNA_ORIENTATION=+